MDAVTGYAGRGSIEGFLNLTNMICDAYTKRIQSFEDGCYPVVFIADDTTYLTKFTRRSMECFSERRFYSAKLGEKACSPKLHALPEQNAGDGFEGLLRYRRKLQRWRSLPLVENGVLKRLSRTKKRGAFPAASYGIGWGEYDGPNSAFRNLKQRVKKDRKELLGARRASSFSSPAVVTSHRRPFATPAQLKPFSSTENASWVC